MYPWVILNALKSFFFANFISVGGGGQSGANVVIANTPSFVNGFQRFMAQFDPCIISECIVKFFSAILILDWGGGRGCRIL